MNSVVFGGVMEVLVKPEHRVDLAEAWLKACGARWLFVYDLERLDESALRAKFGVPRIECHLVAKGVETVEVKLRRKIVAWEV